MRFQIVVFIIVFVVGVAGGFYIALYLQDQIALLAGAAVLFAFLTWLGSGAELLGLLREWHKEKLEKVVFTLEYSPHDNPHLYAPTLELLTVTGQRINVSRKFLKVGVMNNGGKVAKQCKATLQIKTSPPNMRAPSQEPKVLLWENGQNYQDIGIARPEYLHVVLSDSRLGTINVTERNLLALVSTPDTVRMIPPNIIRAQDGFDRGDFDFELIVTCESGETLKATLRVHVTNWQDLAMERVN